MFDLVRNPNCWFSHAQAHIKYFDIRFFLQGLCDPKNPDLTSLNQFIFCFNDRECLISLALLEVIKSWFFGVCVKASYCIS